MYPTFNKGKSAVAEWFIRMLKNKIFKHMTAISRNIYFDVLDDIVNKYNNKRNRNETNWIYIWFLCWIQSILWWKKS